MAKVPRTDENGLRVATYERKRGQVGKVETDDQTEALSIAITSLKKHGGSGAIYPDNDEGFALFRERTINYLQHVQDVNMDESMERKLIPDMESWAVFCGITRQTLHTYEKRGGRWSDFICLTKEGITAVKKQLSFTYKIPPVVAIFDLTNNHGYRNTSQVEIATETEEKTAPRMSEEELQRIVNERAELDDIED